MRKILRWIWTGTVVLVAAVVLLVTLGCFRKKNAKANLPDWLETHFPGRFEVLETSLAKNWATSWDFGSKKSIVAEKADPEVQILLFWEKGKVALRLSTAEVDSAAVSARHNVQQARLLHKLLTTNGLEGFSTSWANGRSVVVLFAEPTPEHRQNTVRILKKTFDAAPSDLTADVRVYYFEPTARGELFKDIVTLEYWERPGTWHQDHLLVYLETDWTAADFSEKAVAKQWTCNTAAARTGKYQDEAEQRVLAWAAEHLKGEVHLAGYTECQLDEKDPLGIRYQFPYYLGPARPDTDSVDLDAHVDGYLTVVYHTDPHTLGAVRQLGADE
jgi:hypothetical protein